MTSCTWTVVTNTRTLTLTGNGTPIIASGNARCVGIFGSAIQVIKLSGEPDGFCSFLSETIVSTSSDCPETLFDCINGNCIASTTYNTPGIFATLADCQAACGQNPGCDGECVSAAEIAALQAAAANARSNCCG